MMWYNRAKLEHLLILEQARKWFRSGLITLEQYSVILAAKRPAYKRSNIFLRIGLFVLTTISLYSSFGLGGLLFNIFDGDTGLKIFLFLASGISFFILKIFINDKEHFKSGVDEALSYNGLGLLIAGIQFSFNHLTADFFLFFLITSIPLVMIATILFIDRLLAVLTFAGIMALVFLFVLKTGPFGRMFLPFILMISSAGIYIWVRKMVKHEKYYFWRGCLDYIGYGVLIVFYLSGNYYIVREGSVILMNFELAPGQDIPFAFVFYIFTAVVPFLYIYYGLKNKEYAFLNLGMLFVAISVLTIRYYYSFLPGEIALILGGTLLLILSWWVMRYLKTPQIGITAEEDKFQKSLLNVTTEALVIAQSFGHVPNQPTETGTNFGGGEFGGGGAGGNY